MRHLIVFLQQPCPLHLLRSPQHQHQLPRPWNNCLQLLLAHVVQRAATAVSVLDMAIIIQVAATKAYEMRGLGWCKQLEVLRACPCGWSRDDSPRHQRQCPVTHAASALATAAANDMSHAQVTRHTSHVTRHTSHVTCHTSHVTRHMSHVTRHTSHVTFSS